MSDVKDKFSNYLQPAFLICAAILAVASVSMSYVQNKFQLSVTKQPVELKKSFDLLDEKGLGSFRVINKLKIENKEIVESLGTEDYIQWVLEDTNLPDSAPEKRFLLFVTYYGRPDRVPHVPEECYTGGGFQKTLSEGITFKIKKGDSEKSIPAKFLKFENKSLNSWGTNAQFPILYFFKVNNSFTNSRETTRIALNKNIFGKHSYFSKVEMAFNQSSVAPDKEQAVSQCQKILNIILPILEDQHWPDIKEE